MKQTYTSQSHAIYFYTNGASEEDCYNILKKVHVKLQDNSNYCIKYLNNHGYIWVCSNKVFNELIKSSIKDDELYEEIVDPEWVKPETNVEDELRDYDYNTMEFECDWDNINKSGLSLSWGEDDDNRNEIIRKHTPPIIRKKIDKLLTNDDISFIDEYANYKQLKFMKVLLNINKNNNPNILITSELPDWVSIKMIISHFKPYLSNRYDEKHKRNYPIIAKHKKNNSIRIELDPNEPSNMFFRLIKYSITLKNPDNIDDEFIIYFNYANIN